MDPRHYASMCKLYGASMVNRVVDRVLQIHGGMGYTRELPIERWYRQVRLFRIFEGTDEMLRLIISRDLLRGYSKIGGHLRDVSGGICRASLATVLAEGARRYPTRTAVVDGDLRVSYADLWQQARSYAAALRQVGVQPGDAVALMVPNVVDFPRAYYGALAAGAVVVPVHLLLTADEAAYVLRDSGATLLLCAHQPARGRRGRRGRRRHPGRDHRPCPAGVSLPAGVRRLEDVAATVDPLLSYVSRSAEDPAVIFFTSGTTGQPKGAVLTHLNLVMNATVNVFDANDGRPTDVVLGCLPLFHTFGQTVGMNGTFRIGATLVLLPRFTGEAAIEMMLREGVNVFHGVPTMYVGLLEAAPSFDRLPQLRLCISGGASLPQVVLERFNETFATSVFEGYGLSETSPTATTNQPHFGTRAGTIGHPIWGVEVEIARAEIDERDRAAAGRRARRDRHPRPQRLRRLPGPARRTPRWPWWTVGSAAATSAARTSRDSSPSSTARRTS